MTFHGSLCAFARDEKEFMKLPKNIEDAKKLGNVLFKYKDRYYVQVLLAYFTAYVLYPLFFIWLLIKTKHFYSLWSNNASDNNDNKVALLCNGSYSQSVCVVWCTASKRKQTRSLFLKCRSLNLMRRIIKLNDLVQHSTFPVFRDINSKC